MRFFKYVLDSRLTQEKIVIDAFLKLFIRYTFVVFLLQFIGISLIILHSVYFDYSFINVMTYTTCIYAIFTVAIFFTVNRFVKNNIFLSNNFIVMWIFLGILVLLSSVFIYYFIVATENTVISFNVWKHFQINREILPPTFYHKVISHLVRNFVIAIITVFVAAILLLAIIVHNFWSIKFFNLLYTFNRYCYNRNAVNSRYSRDYFFEKVAATYYFRWRKYRVLRLLRQTAHLNIPGTSWFDNLRIINLLLRLFKKNREFSY